MKPPLPYTFPPALPTFTVTSSDCGDGETLPVPHRSGVFGAGGEDVSPALAWSGFPAETKSFAVTCFDPDAPTGGGFWHWVVFDIPASVTSLATGAGAKDGSGLPAGARQLRNDGGFPGFIGAAPPEGHGPHRYAFTVHALKVAKLPIDETASPALCGFNMFGNTLARGEIVPIFGR